MPAKCPWCETNSHSCDDQYPICVRVFITKDEAKELLLENPKKTFFVIVNPKPDVLIRAEWIRKEIHNLIKSAYSIELTDNKGDARKMGHGICIDTKNTDKILYFIECDNALIEAYEKKHGV